MNRSIRRVGVVAALMFFALLVNLTASYLLRGPGLLSDPANARVLQEQFDQPRGAILVGNTAVVQTQASTGRFNYQRTYAAGAMYAPVTGYYSFLYGRSKLEQAYNDRLIGTTDTDLLGRIRAVLSNQPAAGATLQTTLDAKAQQAAWDGLAGRKGAVVALDYTTGAILAYASSPSYDPAALAGEDMNAVQKAWTDANADPARPLADRAGSEIYPPGSTFKLVTAAAALENGWPLDQAVPAPATMTLPGTNVSLGNTSSCGAAEITLKQALATSCNTAFANVGLAIGQEKVKAQAEKFGFNTGFGGDLNSAASVFPSDLNPSQLAMSAIGQFEVAATPLQMALVTAAIANGGVEMAPYLVSEVRAPDLAILSQHGPTPVGTPISADTAAKLQDMMVGVVTNGTAQMVAVKGVRIGAKTGTAQSDPNRPNYAWFVGWADKPHVAIAVFVEDAEINEDLITGGRVAAPIFSKVLAALG